MKLEYNILWFEDQPRSVKPAMDNISGAISRLGFKPNIDMREVVADGPDPLENLPNQRDVDLVLMDWKLGGGQDGAVLARRLRRSFSNTDIIFYSSEPAKNLRELIFKQDIDGVHCFHRTTLSDRTAGLVRSQLRKILGVDHMRGIVMAVTSDLDHAMIRCLEVVQALVYPNEPESFARKIGEEVAGAMRSKAAEIEQLASKGKLQKLLKDPNFGASLRLTFLKNEIGKIADKIKEVHLIESLDRYLPEVITPRNDFAHRAAEFKDGKLYLEGRTVPFDEDSMTALRLKLLEHADSLTGLFSLLKEMAAAAGENEAAEKIAAIEDAVAQVGSRRVNQEDAPDEQATGDQQ